MLKGSLLILALTLALIKVNHGFQIRVEDKEDLYEDCGSHQNSTQCFGLPKDCFYTKNCSLWVKFSQCESCDGDVTFNLYGNNLDINSYISVGLSEGNPMNNGSVVFCHAGGVGMTWNHLGDNGYDSLVLANTTGILNAKTNLDDGGTLSCSFKRQKVTNFLTPNAGDEQVFDLGVKEKYILALAKGPIVNHVVPVVHVVPGVHGMSHREDIGHTHYKIDFNPGSETSTVEPMSTTVETTTAASATRTSTGMATIMLVLMMNIN